MKKPPASPDEPLALPPLYEFKDPRLGQLAFTHRSSGEHNNERLEWLGDAIVDMEISYLLYTGYSHLDEGGLSQLRARLVDKPTLAAIARRLNFGRYARLGKNYMRDGRNNSRLLANLMEAYIAAVYLDGGDARALLKTLIQADLDALLAQIQREGVESLRNPKTRLQELVQKHRLPGARYTIINREGKIEAPVFTVECTAGKVVGYGSGDTRAAAEEKAAADCFKQLRKRQAAGRHPAPDD